MHMPQMTVSATASFHVQGSRVAHRHLGCHVLPQRSLQALTVCHTAQQAQVGTLSNDDEADKYIWPGHDQFDAEGDRQDKPPLSLPQLRTAKTITLVRHGQSQWNASGRIQGSCDLSLLTDEGRMQAEAARQQLDGQQFDAFFCSPLQRAAVTGSIIWAGRQGSPQVLPALREIDLYSFQGLFKAEGKQRFGVQYHKWKHDPASLEIDGHPPVRELWHRASLALRSILATEPGYDILVVAHNAVNQALICVSLGLPPTAFRRLVQANAATTVLHFAPSASQEAHDSGDSPAALGSAESRAVLRHMNQSPEVLPKLAADGPPVGGVRILVVACGGGNNDSSHEDITATAGAVSAFQADRLLCDDTPAAQVFREALLTCQHDAALPPQLWHPTQLADGQVEASAQERRCIGDALALYLAQSDHLSSSTGTAGRASASNLGWATAGMTVAVLTSCERAAALLHHFCGLQQDVTFAVAVQPASISCIDAPKDDAAASLADGATVHCVNNCAHLAMGGYATAARAANGSVDAR